jgi:ribosomal protein S18 acetylase RimI-like enzyme
MNTMAVRSMRPEDAAAVARLSDELGYPAEPAEIAARFDRVVGDPDAAVFVAHEGDDVVRGWLHVAATKDLVSAEHGEIRALVVGEEVRGRGIGRRLLDAAEAWAVQRGYGVMKVRSNVVRTRARSFYERAGYAVTKTQHNFRKMLGGSR